MFRSMRVVLCASLIMVMGVCSVRANAGTIDCTSPDNAIFFNAQSGFKNHFLGIGQDWYRKSIPPAAIPHGPLCNSSPTLLAITKTAVANQQRFFVLLRAFPMRPTRAQWNARFKPLVDAAIASDSAFLRLIKENITEGVASFNTSHHCGVAPNPPSECDNQTLPESLRGDLANARSETTPIANDRAWLMRVRSVAYGTNIDGRFH